MSRISIIPDIDLQTETYSIGRKTREWIADGRDVPALNRHFISFTGISESRSGFCFVRRNPEISQVLITTQGYGWVRVDDQWQTLREGMAYVTPRNLPHAYSTHANIPWTCCWVTYTEPANEIPIISVEKPSVVQTNPRMILAAISGLVEESRANGEPRILDMWARLVHEYVCRTVDTWRVPDRLWRVWEQIDDDIAYRWTVPEIARLGHVSTELLRQLCHRHHGRSPMKHVAYLRMRRAAELMQRTELKLDVIAEEVGYDNAFSFSRTFKRIMGCSPRAY